MKAAAVPCSQESHIAIKATATTFAAGTIFVRADEEDDLVLGTCKLCGSTLAYSLEEWRTDGPTLVVERGGEG